MSPPRRTADSGRAVLEPRLSRAIAPVLYLGRGCRAAALALLSKGVMSIKAMSWEKTSQTHHVRLSIYVGWLCSIKVRQNLWHGGTARFLFRGASITRTLKVETVSSNKTSINIYTRLHGATSQSVAILRTQFVSFPISLFQAEAIFYFSWQVCISWAACRSFLAFKVQWYYKLETRMASFMPVSVNCVPNHLGTFTFRNIWHDKGITSVMFVREYLKLRRRAR